MKKAKRHFFMLCSWYIDQAFFYSLWFSFVVRCWELLILENKLQAERVWEEVSVHHRTYFSHIINTGYYFIEFITKNGCVCTSELEKTVLSLLLSSSIFFSLCKNDKKRWKTHIHDLIRQTKDLNVPLNLNKRVYGNNTHTHTKKKKRAILKSMAIR